MRNHVEATVRNMRQYSGVKGMVALDLANGETYSADPRDYFLLRDSDSLIGLDDQPLVLAIPNPVPAFIPLEGS